MDTAKKAGVRRFIRAAFGHALSGIITFVVMEMTASPYWIILEPVGQSVINATAKWFREEFEIDMGL